MSLFKKENKIDITGYDTVVVIIGGQGMWESPPESLQ